MSNHLANRLYYSKGERDMILMRHEVTVVWPDGRRELKGINLVSLGPSWLRVAQNLQNIKNNFTPYLIRFLDM